MDIKEKLAQIHRIAGEVNDDLAGLGYQVFVDVKLVHVEPYSRKNLTEMAVAQLGFDLRREFYGVLKDKLGMEPPDAGEKT